MLPSTAEPPDDRSFAVRGAPASTTARTIARLSSAPRTTRDLAPLGIALRHFTEPVLTHLDVDRVRIHRATTVLTKQVAAAMTGEQPLAGLRVLLTDPHRVATPSGVGAREFCGTAWASIADIAGHRLDEIAAGVAQFGEVSVLRLAALHAADAMSPWWGTGEWETRVARWLDVAPEGSLFRLALLQAPEHVDDAILRELLR